MDTTPDASNQPAVVRDVRPLILNYVKMPNAYTLLYKNVDTTMRDQYYAFQRHGRDTRYNLPQFKLLMTNELGIQTGKQWMVAGDMPVMMLDTPTENAVMIDDFIDWVWQTGNEI